MILDPFHLFHYKHYFILMNYSRLYIYILIFIIDIDILIFIKIKRSYILQQKYLYLFIRAMVYFILQTLLVLRYFCFLHLDSFNFREYILDRLVIKQRQLHKLHSIIFKLHIILFFKKRFLIICLPAVFFFVFFLRL